ncbi:MAG: cellulose binding domain-containing protein [Streptosporangiaceae bacterium]
MVIADDEQPTNEVALPGKPVASAAGAEDTMIDAPQGAAPVTAPVTAPFGHRPQPDVLFAPVVQQAPPPYQGPAFGPEAVTGPQAPIAHPDFGLLPPPVRPRPERRPALMIALVSALGIAVIAVAAFFLWPGGDPRTVAQRAPVSLGPVPSASAPGGGGAATPGAGTGQAPAPPGSAAPDGAVPTSPAVPSPSAPMQSVPSQSVPSQSVPSASDTPQPDQTGAPVSGTTTAGVGVSYQTVEVSPGYVEGVLTITNRTARPMPAWTVSFRYPTAKIRNVWGGVLVRSGKKIVIRNDADTAPIPVGASVSVRFGGPGLASQPLGCLLAGQPCGF